MTCFSCLYFVRIMTYMTVFDRGKVPESFKMEGKDYMLLQ